MRRTSAIALAVLSILGSQASAQTPRQPKVQPGPSEPDWLAILEAEYGLKMYRDLLNPVQTTVEATPGLFKKAGAGNVTYTPVIALGMETVTRGGWYTPGADTRQPSKHDLWSYAFKHTALDIEKGPVKPPPLAAGSSTTFDPGDAPFGLLVSNDNFKDNDGVVFTQPAAVAAINARVGKQPYKAMIYPFKDKATGKVVPHSYLIGWEYSTNDDFQDVVCRVDNVDLITPGR
jgi:hypothetical protein